MNNSYAVARANFIEAWRIACSARVVYEQKRREWYVQGALYNAAAYKEMREARMAFEYAQTRFVDSAEVYAAECVARTGE